MSKEAKTIDQTGAKVAPPKPSRAVAPANVITPMEMLQHAVEKGVDVGVLEKLMKLHQDWEVSTAKKAYTAALTAFKATPPTVTKNKKAGFRGRNSGEEVGYTYATLAQACAAIAPKLSEHGLSHTWEINQDGPTIRVTCVLTHELGHSERVTLQASADTSGAKNSIQAIGSTVSYLQRYTLLAATGLAATDQDDDGQRSETVERAVPNPYLIELAPKGESRFIDFGERFVAAVKGADSLGDIEMFLNANAPALKVVETKAPKAYKSVMAAVQKARTPKQFVVVDLDHKETTYDDALKAATAFHDLVVDAERRGKAALEGLWEANKMLSGRLRDAGFPEAADAVRDDHSAALGRLDGPQGGGKAPPASVAGGPSPKPAEAAKTQGEPSREAKAQGSTAIAPIASPFEVKGGDWFKWCPYFRQLVKLAQGQDGVAKLREQFKKELDYVENHLPVEWDAIVGAIDDRRGG